MRSFLTRVHLYIEEGGGHLKDIVHKKWNYVKKKLSIIVNRDVLKLVSITFSKMLFLFISSSLFLPHSVFKVSFLWGSYYPSILQSMYRVMCVYVSHRNTDCRRRRREVEARKMTLIKCSDTWPSIVAEKFT